MLVGVGSRMARGKVAELTFTLSRLTACERVFLGLEDAPAG